MQHCFVTIQLIMRICLTCLLYGLKSISEHLDIGFELILEDSLIFAVDCDLTLISTLVGCCRYAVDVSVWDTEEPSIFKVTHAIRLEMNSEIAQVQLSQVFRLADLSHIKPE